MRFHCLVPLAFAAVVLLAGARADAFCRSTTCDGDCPRDEAGCKTTGEKLRWTSSCAGFNIQKDGTQNLPMAAVRPVLERAFATWSDAACLAGPPSFRFVELDEVRCHEAEYNPHGPNANIVLFQDNKWTHDGPDDTLAKTTVTYDVDTGEILGADIELNFAYNELTVGDGHIVYDLESIVTHEAGHFLGLDHSWDDEATMNTDYQPGTMELRTLARDDVDGLCAIYPPGRSAKCAPAPRHGLADACQGGGAETDGGGCSTVPGSDSPQGALALALLLPFVRRRSQSPRS